MPTLETRRVKLLYESRDQLLTVRPEFVVRDCHSPSRNLVEILSRIEQKAFTRIELQ